MKLPNRQEAGEITALYIRDFLSIREIARRLGRPRMAVRQILNHAGISIRTKSALAHLRRDRLLPEPLLQRLYQHERHSAARIAVDAGCSRQHVVNRMRELGIPIRDPVESCTRYPKTPFGGDEIQRAYLIGLRAGDLHVKKLNAGGRTFWIECASTRREQLDLVVRLFSPYGRCWIGPPKRNGARGVHALVDESFAFLSPKPRRIAPWILRDSQSFLAFLAGYTDAEGCFGLYRRRARFDIQSYDREILNAIHRRLRTFRITCPPPWCPIQPGRYTNRFGYSNRQAVWRLTVARREALVRLIGLLAPYLQHAKRRRDMQAIQRYYEMRTP